ncbi:MAG TPA: hypothetical protein PLP17_08690, partial [Oligoflexia bacterium]|nr:hypothetical protein [Oligoflexia bacterium]
RSGTTKTRETMPLPIGCQERLTSAIGLQLLQKSLGASYASYTLGSRSSSPPHSLQRGLLNPFLLFPVAFIAIICSLVLLL